MELYSMADAAKEYFEHRDLMDKEIKFEGDYVVLHEWYDISLDRLKTAQDILSWVQHLTEKSWFNSDLCHEFISQVARRQNLNLTVPA